MAVGHKKWHGPSVTIYLSYHMACHEPSSSSVVTHFVPWLVYVHFEACMKCTCFAHWQALLCQPPQVFSRAVGCGARGPPACTLYGATLGPERARRRVLPYSCELALFEGIAFRRAKANQDVGNPHEKMASRVSRIIKPVSYTHLTLPTNREV